MTRKILIDTHVHTKAISHCSRISEKQLIDILRCEGLGGMVLTNHYKSYYFDRDTFADWKKRYVEEYRKAKDYGNSLNFRVFFGVEVTLSCMPENDFLIYGLGEEDILESEDLTSLGLDELSSFAREKGALLFHAHPFRNTRPVDGSFVDGTEINCHPIYRTAAEARTREFADRCSLILTCGSDYHGDCYKAHCGTYIPDSVRTSADFTAFLKKEKRPELLIAPDPAEDTSMAPGSGVLPYSLEAKLPQIIKILERGD